MKKAAMIVLALIIGVVFASTGFTQDKPAAAPADKAVAAPEKAKDEAAKETKKPKKAKKAKAKKEAKPAEEKAAAPEKAADPAKK
jgi:hypothetical protein